MKKNYKLPSRYFDRVKEIGLNQNCNEFYSQHFSRHISKFFSAAFSYFNLSPNYITLSMFFFGILGGILFSFGSEPYYILGSISLMILNIADTVDGEVARYTNKTSLGGDYLDRVAHVVTNSFAILGMGIGLYFQFGSPWILFFAVLVEIFYSADDVSRDLLVTCGLAKAHSSRKNEKKKTQAFKSKKIHRFGQIIGSNMGFFHLIALVAILDLCFPFQFGFNFTLVYFITFGLITIFKLCIRIYRIRLVYFS